jgi:hypothetical protein
MARVTPAREECRPDREYSHARQGVYSKILAILGDQRWEALGSPIPGGNNSRKFEVRGCDLGPALQTERAVGYPRFPHGQRSSVKAGGPRWNFRGTRLLFLRRFLAAAMRRTFSEFPLTPRSGGIQPNVQFRETFASQLLSARMFENCCLSSGVGGVNPSSQFLGFTPCRAREFRE